MQLQLVAAFTLATSLAVCSLSSDSPSVPSRGAAEAVALDLPASIAPPLVVECPEETLKIFCGLPYDPTVAGEPTVSGGCAPYTVDFADSATTPAACQAERFVQIVTRTWTITDTCGNSATCRQDIHILKDLVYFDAHPRSCPNPFNRGANGKYPAAIVGTPSFDVTQIVPSSLRLYVLHCAGGSIAPLAALTRVEDVVAPYTDAQECGCTTDGPDGYPDLTFKFDARAMGQALGLGAYARFSDVKIVIVGDMTNGCKFIGLDCIRVQ